MYPFAAAGLPPFPETDVREPVYWSQAIPVHGFEIRRPDVEGRHLLLDDTGELVQRPTWLYALGLRVRHHDRERLEELLSRSTVRLLVGCKCYLDGPAEMLSLWFPFVGEGLLLPHQQKVRFELVIDQRSDGPCPPRLDLRLILFQRVARPLL